jgi:hypothetical protein
VGIRSSGSYADHRGAFEHARENAMMEGVGDMMWGMGLVWVLVLVVLLLVIAALIKYLRS